MSVKPATYILRNIDPELWNNVHRRSKADDVKIRRVLLALLRMYVDRRVTVTGEFAHAEETK
jgi:hypothetical protein